MFNALLFFTALVNELLQPKSTQIFKPVIDEDIVQIQKYYFTSGAKLQCRCIKHLSHDSFELTQISKDKLV